MNGAIIINKPSGVTSRDIINQLNKILETRQIGHTGTLDPLATGVLVCLVGKCTKLANILVHDDKEYIATFELGLLTDTLDITGKVLKQDDYIVNKEELLKAINSFKGYYMQEVPNYSAIKIKGKRLYEYARNNETIDLPKRKVNIKEIELLELNNNLVTIRALVSKGTYIRSLIRDIGTSLNTSATLTSLERTKLGDFYIKDAVSIDDVLNNKYHLYTVDELLRCPVKEMDEETYFKVKNGQIITYDIYDYIIFSYHNEFIAVYQKYDQEGNIKPLIMF